MSAKITVRHLLNQISGLSPQNYVDPSLTDRLPPKTSLEDALRDLQTLTPTSAVGTTFAYFDPNYWTLVAIIEAVSGQPYAEYVEEHVFRPLNMAQTTTTASQTPPTPGHISALGWAFPSYETIAYKYLVGCCGVITSAEDLGHYLIAQTNGGQYRGTQIVSAESIAQMHAPRTDLNSPYGMGWFGNGEPDALKIFHSGGWRTYHTEVALLPKQGYGIALLFNQGGLLKYLVYNQITDGLIRILQGQTPPKGVTMRTINRVLSAFMIVTIGWQFWTLWRVRLWKACAAARPRWRRNLALGWPFVLAALLFFGFPRLAAPVIGGVWPWMVLLKWQPDVCVWLLLLALLSLCKGLGRFYLTQKSK